MGDTGQREEVGEGERWPFLNALYLKSLLAQMPRHLGRGWHSSRLLPLSSLIPWGQLLARRSFHSLIFPQAQEKSSHHLGSLRLTSDKLQRWRPGGQGHVLCLHLETTVPWTGLPSASVIPTMHLPSDSSCHTHLKAIIQLTVSSYHIPGPQLCTIPA